MLDCFYPGGDSCCELTNNLTSIYLNFNNDDGELSRSPVSRNKSAYQSTNNAASQYQNYTHHLQSRSSQP